MDNVQAWVQIGTWCVSLSTSMLYNQCDCKQKPLFFTSPLGPCWARLGQVGLVFALSPILGPMLALCLCWPMLALSWPMLALSWPLCWPYVGLCWPHVGPSCGPCWGYVGDMWDHLYWKTSKMPIFPFRTPPRNQKPRKNCGFFYFCEQKKCARPSAQSTVKHGVFVTSHTGNTVNYGDLVAHSSGGGSAAEGGGGERVSGQGPPGPCWPCPCRCSSSLLSEGERGRHPAADQLTAFYVVFAVSYFVPFFGSCGSRWVNMGHHRLQHRPT